MILSVADYSEFPAKTQICGKP